MLHLLCSSAPGPFLPSSFPAGWPPGCTDTWVFPSQVQDLGFLLVELNELQSAYFSSLLKSLWMAV